MISIRVLEEKRDKQPAFFDLMVEVIGLREAPNDNEAENDTSEIKIDEKDGIEDQKKTLDYSDPDNIPADRIKLGSFPS